VGISVKVSFFISTSEEDIPQLSAPPEQQERR
jgi:hypothetical protein